MADDKHEEPKAYERKVVGPEETRSQVPGTAKTPPPRIGEPSDLQPDGVSEGFAGGSAASSDDGGGET
jgi:hypothetical protein